MSMPVNKQAVERLQEAYDKNMEAGDWVYSSPPMSAIPIPVEENLSPEAFVKLVGPTPVPKKK